MTEPRPGALRAAHPRPRARHVSSVTPASPGATGWSVVLPFKGGAAAKSRLGAPAPLATAIALDCLDAVAATPEVRAVVVVTPDPELAAAARAAGARVVAESTPGGGLLAAVADGLRAVSGPTAVLLGDLPALRPADLAAALRGAAEALPPSGPDGSDGSGGGNPAMAFVPDADGIGTVLLAARSPQTLRPSFGPASAAAHAADGAVRLDLDLPRLRRDVDTPDDLRTALELGVGPRTAAYLETDAALPH